MKSIRTDAGAAMQADPPQLQGHPVGDRSARQHFIARSIVFTVPGAAAVLAAAYAYAPLPAGAAQGLVPLALAWLLVAVLPYVAVCLHITGQRFFEGSHDPLAGAESERLKIHCRVMQNTLEQFVWFACALLGLATLMAPERAGFIPVACVAFALSRFVYWWGYLRRGTLGRAPGVQLSFTINIGVLGLALLLFVQRLLA